MGAPCAPSVHPANTPEEVPEDDGEKVPRLFQISPEVVVDLDYIERHPNVTGDGPLIPVREGLWRLPDEEVLWILSRVRENIRPDLFGPDSVETLKEVRDAFFEHQAWVRAQYDANGGYVYLDDQDARDREEHQQRMTDWIERISNRLSDCLDISEDEEKEKDEEEVQQLNTN